MLAASVGDPFYLRGETRRSPFHPYHRTRSFLAASGRRGRMQATPTRASGRDLLMSTPREGHASRKIALEGQAEEGARLSRMISTSRLVSFVGACAIAFARGFGYLPPWFGWLAGGLAIAFVFLVLWHLRLDAKERRVTAAIDYHRWAIARLDGKFEDYPSRGDRFVSEDHPYSLDL